MGLGSEGDGTAMSIAVALCVGGKGHTVVVPQMQLLSFGNCPLLGCVDACGAVGAQIPAWGLWVPCSTCAQRLAGPLGPQSQLFCVWLAAVAPYGGTGLWRSTRADVGVSEQYVGGRVAGPWDRGRAPPAQDSRCGCCKGGEWLSNQSSWPHGGSSIPGRGPAARLWLTPCGP